MSTAQQLIHGIFIESDIDFIKRKKGDAALETIEKKLDGQLNLKSISLMKKYPVELEIKLITEASKLIYGECTPQTWQLWGQKDFETIKNSALGKVMFSLFKEPIKVFPEAVKLFDFFLPTVHFDYKNLTEDSVMVILENDPYPKDYFSGIFRGFFSSFNKEVRLMVREENGSHIYMLNWQ